MNIYIYIYLTIGRVYFHCHHVLDVLAGQAIAVAVSLLLLRPIDVDVYVSVTCLYYC